MSTSFEKTTEVSLHPFHELARVREVAEIETSSEPTANTVSRDTTQEVLHELSQPLTAICSFGAVAMHSIDQQPKHPNELRQLRSTLQQIINASNLAAGIITRFRDATNGCLLQTRPIDVNEIVENSIEILTLAIQAKGIQIGYNGIPAHVEVDPVQIQEVLINLIRNSIEAVSEQDGQININISEQFGHVEVSVSDNGPGVDEAIRDELFQPVASRKENGMGIGLALSRSIIETHGGKIWCSANHPKGASFHFTLPMPQLAY